MVRVFRGSYNLRFVAAHFEQLGIRSAVGFLKVNSDTRGADLIEIKFDQLEMGRLYCKNIGHAPEGMIENIEKIACKSFTIDGCRVVYVVFEISVYFTHNSRPPLKIEERPFPVRLDHIEMFNVYYQ